MKDLVPGKRYLRYAYAPGLDGKGWFLVDSDRIYGSAAEAARELDLTKLPRVVQVVQIRDHAQGIRSDIREGAPGIEQIALPSEDVYRIVEEYPIQ